MVSPAKARANTKYDKTHTKQFKVKFNLKYDADVIEKMESVDNKQNYIRSLIRADIARTKAFTSAKRTAAEKVFTGTAYDPAVMISETADADESIKALVSEEKFVEFWTNYFTGKLADLSK